MSDKYQQSQQESVMLLKRVIAEMGQHDAPFNPTTFAVFYELQAGINPALAQAFAQARQARPRLDTQAIAELYRDHVAEPDAQAAASARGELQRVMRGVAQSAADTGNSVRAYGTQLAGLSEALESEPPHAVSPTLAPRLHEVANGTAQMQTTVAAFELAMQEGEREIERLQMALERARVEAITDALSRLRNRKGFDEVLRDTLQKAAPEGQSHCLVVLDLDHFKRVNDTHGHPVGDAVIEGVGQILTKAAGVAKGFAARIGGEEFALLMPSTTIDQARHAAEAIRTKVRSMTIRKRGTQEVIDTVTVSAGVAAWHAGEDGAHLLAAADAALYRSKQSGRDRVTLA